MNDETDIMVGPVNISVVDVKALEGFRIWLRFNDGVEGAIDLGHHAGKDWFKPIEDRRVFENVWASRHGGDIRWGDDPDEVDLGMCATALYMDLTGKTWEELEREANSLLTNA